MSLQTLKDQKGFTIVELLIVIVVIGILAAITIVAFNGVQSQAKTTKAQAVASDAQKKAEAYNATNSEYPSLNQLQTATGVAQLSTGNSVTGDTLTAGTGEDTAHYRQCGGGTGAEVSHWNFSDGGQVVLATMGSGCS